jgi:hypothetical protein
VVFFDVIPYSLIGGYHRFEGIYYFHLQFINEYGENKATLHMQDARIYTLLFWPKVFLVSFAIVQSVWRRATGLTDGV